MPLMHSERMADQARAVALYAADGGDQFEFAKAHARQIARFARFPQRNAALGRANTAEEEAFLAEPGSSF